MRSLQITLLLALLWPAAVLGHEFPKPTPQGVKDLLALIERCQNAGGLRAAKDPRTGEPYLIVADADKLLEAVRAHRQHVTPALCDALIGGWEEYAEREEPFAIALLQAIGQTKDDDRARAFAAAFQAKREQRARRHRAALRLDAEAGRLFEALGDRGWLATMLNDSGVLHRERGELSAALKDYRRALALRRALYGPRHEVVATCLNNIGVVLQQQGRTLDALACHEQALAIRRQHFPSPHRLIARSLLGVGLAHHELQQYDRALQADEEALANLRRPTDRDLIAEALNNIGGVHQSRGEYDLALKHYREAGDLRLALHGTMDHPDVANSTNNLASVHALRGDYHQALVFFEVTLGIDRRLFPGGHPATAGTLNNLALTCLRLGDLDRALSYGKQALAMRQALFPANHPEVARSLNNLAGILEQRGESARALDHYRRALAAWRAAYAGRLHPDVAIGLDNLASALHRAGDDRQAARLAHEAQQMFRQVFGPSHPEYAAALGNEAYFRYRQGDHDAALRGLDDALRAMALPPGDRLPSVGRLDAGQLRPLPQTVKLLQLRGLAGEERLGDGGGVEDWLDVAGTYTLAAAVLERVRQDAVTSEAGRLQVGEETFQLFPRLLGARLRLFALDGNPEHLEAAFAAAERGTARLFLQALGQSRARVVGPVGAPLLREEAELRRRQQELERRWAGELDRPAGQRDPEALDRLLDEMKQVEGQLRELADRMAKAYPRYADWMYPRPCSPEQARACLGPSEVAVVYVPGERASYAVVLEGRPTGDRAGGLALYRLAPAGELASRVAALADRDTLELPEQARGLGAELYRLVLGPLADRIRGKDLVIVPGGPLGHLPFELLVEDADGEDGGRYLVEQHRIRYAPSLTVLHLTRTWEKARPRPDQPLWIVGDPIYEASDARLSGREPLDVTSQEALAEYGRRARPGQRPTASRLKRLSFSGAEVRCLASLLGARPEDARSGRQATEAAVKAASGEGLLARYRYVHFATHGILGLDEGRQPGLVLSLVGNNGKEEGGGRNDGILQLDEVTGLKLNADLVVLSACRTGQGRLSDSEGVEGLARGFLYAGSRGVVCSLWSVDDQETVGLMTAMYGHLKEGKPAADALRAAKLKMIHDGKPPFFWAPFILIGQ